MASRKKFVVANWKMNPKTMADAKKLFIGVKKYVNGTRGVQVVVCPPVAFLVEIRKLYIGKNILFGAQDVYMEKSGSHTGSTSAAQAKSVGASYTIIGHSERRATGETDEDTAKKLRTAVDEKLTALLCVGEHERDEHGEYLERIRGQIGAALQGVAKDELKRVVIVYEPVWAIGKSFESAMKPHDVHQMSLFIHKVLAEKYDRESAMKVPVLYGGSVEPENCASLIKDGDVNGFLVGHASLDPESFGGIVACVSAAR